MVECYFKPATLLKVTLLHGCFSRFLNCTNGIKSSNSSRMFAGVMATVMLIVIDKKMYLFKMILVVMFTISGHMFAIVKSNFVIILI